MHALKYEGWPEVADFMGRRMARAVGWRPFVSRAVIVPVPTTASRVRARGYNQAALLADVVADRLGGTSAHGVLLRRRGGTSQTALSPERRTENVRGAFGAGPDADAVRDRAVLLVDDVLTTGATGLEAAATLQEAGAAEVRLLAFARALPGRDLGGRAA